MITLALYVCPQTVLSSLFGAIDAFQLANQFAESPRFKLLRISSDGQEVRTVAGTVTVDGSLARARSAGIFIVPAIGRDVERTIADNQSCVDWLREQGASGARRMSALPRFASLCSGAFLLGAAGMLEGRRATTHWALEQPFRRRFPGARLVIDAMLTHDGNVFCSAGAQAGLDLCLYLIGLECGDWVARQVANAMVFELGRERQSRFAPTVPVAVHQDAVVARLQLWMDAHFADPITLDALAERAHCSPRTLLRRFKAATGMTPNEYLQRIRIAAAQGRLANSAAPVESVAAAVGYQDRAAFAKLFKRIAGSTPSAYRHQQKRVPAADVVDATETS